MPSRRQVLRNPALTVISIGSHGQPLGCLVVSLSWPGAGAELLRFPYVMWLLFPAPRGERSRTPTTPLLHAAPPAVCC